MIHFPSFWHAPEDDMAPADYSSVRSVSEGRRRAQLRNIHPQPAPDLPPLQPRQVDEYGIPENPFQPPVSQPRRSRAQRYASEAQPSFQESSRQTGPQFDAPVSPEIPDWLKVARQNNYSVNDRPQGPRV